MICPCKSTRLLQMDALDSPRPLDMTHDSVRKCFFNEGSKPNVLCC